MKKKLLVVDDDPMMRMVIQMHLERGGYEVVLAEDGEKAKSVALDSLPDGFVVDLMMPEVDGCQFLKWKKEQENLKTKPAVMLTAVGEEKLLADVVKNLADAVLRKPIEGPALMGTLQRLLKED